MNPSKKAISRPEQLKRARMIRKTLGARVAAAYMRNTGWSFEAAVYQLLGAPAVERIPPVDDKYAPLGAQE